MPRRRIRGGKPASKPSQFKGINVQAPGVQFSKGNNPQPISKGKQIKQMKQMKQVASQVMSDKYTITPEKLGLMEIINNVYGFSSKTGESSKTLTKARIGPSIPRELMRTSNVINHLSNLARASQAGSSPVRPNLDEKMLRSIMITVLQNSIQSYVSGNPLPMDYICESLINRVKSQAELLRIVNEEDIVNLVPVASVGQNENPVLRLNFPKISNQVISARVQDAVTTQAASTQTSIQGAVSRRRQILGGIAEKIKKVNISGESEKPSGYMSQIKHLFKFAFYTFVPGSVIGTQLIKQAFDKGVIEINPEGQFGDASGYSADRETRYLSAISLYMLFIDMLDKYTNQPDEDVMTILDWGLNTLLDMYEGPQMRVSPEGTVPFGSGNKKPKKGKKTKKKGKTTKKGKKGKKGKKTKKKGKTMLRAYSR